MAQALAALGKGSRTYPRRSAKLSGSRNERQTQAMATATPRMRSPTPAASPFCQVMPAIFHPQSQAVSSAGTSVSASRMGQ